MAIYDNIALLGGGTGTFIAEYGTNTYAEISSALLSGQIVVVKVNYDTDKYRYALLTDQTAVDNDTNYYTFTCVIGTNLYTYKVSDLDVWSTVSTVISLDTIFIAEYNVTTYAEITNALSAEKMVFVKKEIATNSYQYAPLVSQSTNYIFKYNDGSVIYTYSVTSSDVWSSSSQSITTGSKIFVATLGTTTGAEILAALRSEEYDLIMAIKPSSFVTYNEHYNQYILTDYSSGSANWWAYFEQAGDKISSVQDYKYLVWGSTYSNTGDEVTVKAPKISLDYDYATNTFPTVYTTPSDLAGHLTGQKRDNYLLDLFIEFEYTITGSPDMHYRVNVKAWKTDYWGNDVFNYTRRRWYFVIPELKGTINARYVLQYNSSTSEWEFVPETN